MKKYKEFIKENGGTGLGLERSGSSNNKSGEEKNLTREEIVREFKLLGQEEKEEVLRELGKMIEDEELEGSGTEN